MAVTTNKPLDLVLLAQQLAAAGINTGALGTAGALVHTYRADGQPLDLPASAQAVVDAHDYQQGATFQQGQEDNTALADFRANLLTGAQALGWAGNLQTGAWGANTGQWDALTPANRTLFMRRLLMALAAMARRTG